MLRQKQWFWHLNFQCNSVYRHLLGVFKVKHVKPLITFCTGIHSTDNSIKTQLLHCCIFCWIQKLLCLLVSLCCSLCALFVVGAELWNTGKHKNVKSREEEGKYSLSIMENIGIISISGPYAFNYAIQTCCIVIFKFYEATSPPCGNWCKFSCPVKTHRSSFVLRFLKTYWPVLPS